jgi:hypothetical protein
MEWPEQQLVRDRAIFVPVSVVEWYVLGILAGTGTKFITMSAVNRWILPLLSTKKNNSRFPSSQTLRIFD